MKMISIAIVLSLFFSCKDNTTALRTEISQLQAEIENLQAEAEKGETGFIHTVYFYAKKDISEARLKEFMEGLETLARVPSISEVWYGPPADTPREVVDNSYTIAWICHFKDAADQEAYQVDPIHVKFVEEYNDVWEKVIVYDNLVQ